MASSLGVAFEEEFVMDSFADLAPITMIPLADSENEIAMGTLQLPLGGDEHLGIDPKVQTENIPKVLSNFDLEQIDPDADAAVPAPSSEKEIDADAAVRAPSSEKEIDIPIILSVEDHTGCDSEPNEEPAVWLNGFTDKMRLMVIVSMVTPYGDGEDTLVHTGDFIIEVTPATTIRSIKYGITNTLDICYEDMALVFVGKFLSDARTIAYYFIDDGQTLHLLVEAPNKLFKDVFEEFKRLNLNEERAWFATRSFIHIMHNKYGVEGLGDDETPALTEELLLQELEQIYVPGTDESDVSSAEDEDAEPESVNWIIVGTMQLGFVDAETYEDNSDEEFLNENHNSGDENDNSDAEDENSEDGEDNEGDDEDDDFFHEVEQTEYLISQAMAVYNSVE